ncbi:uncharacterized protein (TIRG00374 family) [Methanosalsum natronophilum]|nr:uncharacterized protein (TIRG00374 family) [Methanosalsum natronophilum]
MCSALNYDISSLKATEIITSGAFAATFTPSSAGGEPVRIHLLNKHNIPLGKSTAIVLAERLLDAFFIVLTLPFALYIFGDLLSSSGMNAFLIYPILFSIFIIMILIYALWRPDHTRNVVHFIANKIGKTIGKTADKMTGILSKIDSELDNFHNSISLFLTDGKIGLIYGICFTIFYWLVQFSILPLILLGLNLNPSVIAAYSAQILITLISIAAITPGSSGIVELGATPIFALFVPSPMLGLVVIAWRSITYYLNIVIGGFVSIKILKDMDIINRILD